MNEHEHLPVSPGQRVPLCYGMSADRQFYSFEAQAGRPAAMILAHQVPLVRLRPLISEFARRLDAFAARRADVLLLGSADVVRGASVDRLDADGVRMIDCGADCLARCGASAGVAVVLLTDRNLRLAGRFLPEEPADVVAACLDCLDRLPHEPQRDVALPAPVLVLPHLLPRALCRALIETFESGVSIDGGVATVDAAGVPQGRIEHERKRRRDLLIPPGGPLERGLKRLLLARCAPEMTKAFQARVAYTDRLLIARYDQAQSWFRRHRDNTAANVAFREFAISVNLNAEEYEGGWLLFPEYNDHRYSPPTGGGLIFSSSVLHEATPVLQGRRYVLLTFLHGEAAEARRRDYVARSSARPVAEAG